MNTGFKNSCIDPIRERESIAGIPTSERRAKWELNLACIERGTEDYSDVDEKEEKELTEEEEREQRIYAIEEKPEFVSSFDYDKLYGDQHLTSPFPVQLHFEERP